mmetsp:Transcript_12037/g.15568  ORF Transcript_12037/g.15568 Transcript_12037/m.15568 type:complete len:245 (-) Transcript_12037:381-1115(-)
MILSKHAGGNLGRISTTSPQINSIFAAAASFLLLCLPRKSSTPFLAHSAASGLSSIAITFVASVFTAICSTSAAQPLNRQQTSSPLPTELQRRNLSSPIRGVKKTSPMLITQPTPNSQCVVIKGARLRPAMILIFPFFSSPSSFPHWTAQTLIFLGFVLMTSSPTFWISSSVVQCFGNSWSNAMSPIISKCRGLWTESLDFNNTSFPKSSYFLFSISLTAETSLLIFSQFLQCFSFTMVFIQFF